MKRTITLYNDETATMIEALLHAIEATVENEKNALNDKWTLQRLAREHESRADLLQKLRAQLDGQR